MNISRAISAVVLAGATALGAAGVASTAHAQEANATTATDEVAALDPEDALPPHGYQLLPGQNIEVEVAAWKAHAVALWLRTEEASPREAAVVMTVQGISRYSWGFSDDLQVNAGGQDITIRDRW